MKLLETLEKTLKKEPNFITDNGELKKWVIINKAQDYDEELIELLLSEKEIKEKFFKKIKDVTVFNQALFIQFLEQKNYLNDSYTQYKNKVGLTIDGKYLKQRNEVALVWPFKDCVLEGGQSKEEQKRDEIFFNEILAQDEITQLLEPKVLTNVKRYSTDGESKLDSFKRNDKGIITDNLIIKGNNLLALHSLKKEFEGKVKLIYIDPPYNTGNDSFRYNDNFNHSTWLTFMKNRMQIAKSLLSNDGVIFIHIDIKEVHYIKILMDEIFGRENLINEIIWKRRGGALNQPKCLGNVVDYILFYSKTQKYTYNQIKTLDDENTKKYIKERFINDDGDGRLYMKSPLSAPEDRPTLKYKYKGYNPPPNGWLVTIDKLEQWDKENRLCFPEDKTKRISRKIYLDEYDGQPLNCLWTDIYVINPMSNESVDFVGQKPESLLERIINIASNENDIILDFNFGTGTTGVVAHKLKRQWIGIEQLDYGKIDSYNRVQNVVGKKIKKNGELLESIEFDNAGISKSVNWQGGGSFVYLELKKYNATFIEQIEKGKDTAALLAIWEEMKKRSFLNYNVDIKKQDEHIEDFKKLTLQQQKEHLCELLDKNQLYVNLSSMDDKDFSCTDDEKRVTKDFYGIKE